MAPCARAQGGAGRRACAPALAAALRPPSLARPTGAAAARLAREWPAGSAGRPASAAWPRWLQGLPGAAAGAPAAQGQPASECGFIRSAFSLIRPALLHKIQKSNGKKGRADRSVTGKPVGDLEQQQRCKQEQGWRHSTFAAGQLFSCLPFWLEGERLSPSKPESPAGNPALEHRQTSRLPTLALATLVKSKSTLCSWSRSWCAGRRRAIGARCAAGGACAGPRRPRGAPGRGAALGSEIRRRVRSPGGPGRGRPGRSRTPRGCRGAAPWAAQLSRRLAWASRHTGRSASGPPCPAEYRWLAMAAPAPKPLRRVLREARGHCQALPGPSQTVPTVPVRAACRAPEAPVLGTVPASMWGESLACTRVVSHAGQLLGLCTAAEAGTSQQRAVRSLARVIRSEQQCSCDARNTGGAKLSVSGFAQVSPLFLYEVAGGALHSYPAQSSARRAAATQHARALAAPAGARSGAMAGATAGAADLAAYRQRLWSAIAAESAKGLEGGLLEVVVAELQAGRSSGFRRVLLQALDGSSVAQNSRTSDLLQRFAEDARGGSAEAAVLLGALLCFHAMFNSEARACAPPPARALLSPCCPAVRLCVASSPGTLGLRARTRDSWHAVILICGATCHKVGARGSEEPDSRLPGEGADRAGDAGPGGPGLQVPGGGGHAREQTGPAAVRAGRRGRARDAAGPPARAPGAPTNERL